MKKSLAVLLVIALVGGLASCAVTVLEEPEYTYEKIEITHDNFYDYFELSIVGVNCRNYSGDVSYVESEYTLCFNMKDEYFQTNEKNMYYTFDPITDTKTLTVTVKGDRARGTDSHRSMDVVIDRVQSTYFKVTYAYSEAELAGDNDYSMQYSITDFQKPEFSFLEAVSGHIYHKVRAL